jgi:hypothetical protein
MEALFKALELLPGWIITSFIVIFMSVLNYVAFRASVGKDIAFQRDAIGKSNNDIKELFKKTDELEQHKATESHITEWRAEMRTDFQGFKDDVRENIREFKNDVQFDINNVLAAIKKNNGVK